MIAYLVALDSTHHLALLHQSYVQYQKKKAKGFITGPPPNVQAHLVVVGSRDWLGLPTLRLIQRVSGALRVSEEALFPNRAVLETKFSPSGLLDIVLRTSLDHKRIGKNLFTAIKNLKCIFR